MHEVPRASLKGAGEGWGHGSACALFATQVCGPEFQSQNPHKKSVVVTHHCNLSTGGCRRQAGPRDLLAGQASQSSIARPIPGNGRPCLYRGRGSGREAQGGQEPEEK